MHYKEISRQELENLYSHQGITRKELRHLLKISPNRIPGKLSENFRKKMNTFKVSMKTEVTVQGFLHSPPKQLLKTFNSIHYSLLSELGDYNLLLLSSSPLDLTTMIPLVVPKNLVKKKDLSNAHFAAITGNINSLSNFNETGPSINFLVGKEVELSGFTELFSLTDILVNVDDLIEMLRDRFNTPDLLTRGVVSWLMSSPVYEGRAGGNAFSPISPFDDQYKCTPKLLDDFQSDLLNIPLPYFTNTRSKKATIDLEKNVKTNIKYFRSHELNYQYEKDLGLADSFLNKRHQTTSFKDAEHNLSTGNIILDSIRSRPLESFVTKPLLPAKVLTHTDLPLLFCSDELAIDKSQTEIYDFSMDITQLIYQAHLRFPRSPFEFPDTAGVVKKLMDNLKKTMPELHELMVYGIIFNTNPINGLGEHLIRVSNSIIRMDNESDSQKALIKSERLFEEIITKLFDEFNKPITDLYYLLDEKRVERDQIRTHKLRNTVNSILFELNNTFPDGWAYELFETALKKRSGQGSAQVKEIFQKLINQKEVTERTPGLYWHILGFDRYL